MEPLQPKVSVIIPAYQAERYIRQAIQSVLDQTDSDLIEILVIDDASSDGTQEAVLQLAPQAKDGVFCRKNRFLRYHRNEENCKVAYTRNYGVGLARGKYIAFLDADDWWTPDKIEKQIRELEQGEESFCFCFSSRELMDENGNSMQKIIPVPNRVTFDSMLKTNYVTCSSVLMKRELALSCPMDHDQYCEDYICWMRILKKGEAAVGINEPLVKYRMIKGSKSNDKIKATADHYHSLRVLGIGPARTAFYMVSYIINGIKKYF